jgi:crotonobetainyl-CoA:carnitine CoA-transferase CaiB-like acyl-CoA transferase
MSLTGEPDSPPTKTGVSLVDYAGGFVGALALLAGLHAARRDGVGGDCDISLFDTALTLLTYPATWHLNRGWEPKRTVRSAHPSLVPFQLFQGSDDVWFLVGCAKEKFFRRLCESIGHPELISDRRFVDFAARAEHKDKLIGLLDDVFATRSAADWVHTLRQKQIPTGLVNDVAAALAEPQTAARNLIIETGHHRFGTVKTLASPVKVGDRPVTYSPAPRRNEHADHVLRGILNYGTDAIAELRAAGAFGDP